MAKFRILYRVAEPLSAATEASARTELEVRSDDLDEFAAQACSGKVSATLQEQVNLALPGEKGPLWMWKDIETI